MAETTNEPVEVPGQEQPLSGKALKTGAKVAQNMQAINPCQHVCGFHMAAHDSTRQVRPAVAVRTGTFQHSNGAVQCGTVKLKKHQRTAPDLMQPRLRLP